mgnify:CR=1 FL=1
MRSKYDAIFETMDDKEAAEFTNGDPEKIKFMQEVKNIQINPDEKNAINQQIQSLYKVKFGFPREAVISELDDLVLNLSKFIVNIDSKKTPPLPSKASSSTDKPAGD